MFGLSRKERLAKFEAKLKKEEAAFENYACVCGNPVSYQNKFNHTYCRARASIKKLIPDPPLEHITEDDGMTQGYQVIVRNQHKIYNLLKKVYDEKEK
jgi:hypothetical protein